MNDDKMKKSGGKEGMSKLGSSKPGTAPQPPAKTPQPAIPDKQPQGASKFGSAQPPAQQPVKPVVGSKTLITTGTPAQTPAETTPINTEEIAAAVSALQTRFNGFLNRVNLSSYEQRITDITNKVTALPADIAAIRSRGYAFRSFLENKAEVLAQQWQQAQERIQDMVHTESQTLRRELEQAEPLMQKLAGQAGNAAAQSQLVPTLQSALDGLEAKIGAAESLIEGMCSSLERELQQTRGQLDEINKILDKKEAASFSFNPAEAVFLVAEAEWADDRDTPNGNLFLTDQRLVFEQSEKVGKKLGMFGGKEVHEMKWEFPLTSIESVEAENKGLLGGKDMLNFTLGSGAPYGKLTVEVKGGVDCKVWASQIRRMMSGNAQDERAIEPDSELIERLPNAPTSCHICGGTLPQIVAGQDSVTCSYCGVVIRV